MASNGARAARIIPCHSRRPWMWNFAPAPVLLAGVMLFVSFTPPASARAAPERSSLIQAEAYLSRLATAGKFSGTVLVARNGRPLFERAYGYAVAGWSIPNTTDTRFEIASLTKQFTGAAVLQLAEAGKLDLDSPVSRYYPAAPAAWADVTVRMLANHTSGLPKNEIKDFTKGIAVPYTPDELVATFRDRPLAFRPGSSWAYTNTEYYLLAWIVEKQSGQSLGDYLARHIFAPAGMTHSGFVSTLAVVPRAAEGYTRENGRLRHRDYFDRSVELGAGGIYTTVGDLARWNAALDAGRLLKPAALTAMFTPSVPGGYGFGWFITRRRRLREFHEGSDPGFAAFEARYPDDGLLIVILSNLEAAPVRQIESELANAFLTGSLRRSTRGGTTAHP
jgi:D-alanyl-D-alanine carboxypeptidase